MRDIHHYPKADESAAQMQPCPFAKRYDLVRPAPREIHTLALSRTLLVFGQNHRKNLYRKMYEARVWDTIYAYNTPLAAYTVCFSHLVRQRPSLHNNPARFVDAHFRYNVILLFPSARSARILHPL